MCAIAFRVQDAKAAHERAISLGAWGYAGVAGPGELNIPAIKGIGDLIIYLIDKWRGKRRGNVDPRPGDMAARARCAAIIRAVAQYRLTTPAHKTTRPTRPLPTTLIAACMSASQNCCPAWPAMRSLPPCRRTQIPRFDDINERLSKATGWRLVAVPRLIPEVPFFTLLAKRQFPVTDWIRQPKELDYIVEPDVFHDLFVYRLQHRQLPAKLLCD